MLSRYRQLTGMAFAILASLFSTQVFADELNGANTAWILTSTALVLFMTIPGLSLFYGGLVRSKNTLSIITQVLPPSVTFCFLLGRSAAHPPSVLKAI